VFLTLTGHHAEDGPDESLIDDDGRAA
jgi:hypothetical protein